MSDLSCVVYSYCFYNNHLSHLVCTMFETNLLKDIVIGDDSIMILMSGIGYLRV